MKRILIVAVAGLALVYISDYVFLRIKMSAKDPSAAYGVVKIQPLYEIPHKDGKAEYMFGDPQNQTCVRALFPHSGFSTCWYLNTKRARTVPMVILPLASVFSTK
ncbi:MAG TPA: hypothetical protein VIH76_02170 [Candidatus Acidoferrales bacterium]